METNQIVTIFGAGFIGRYVVRHLDRKGFRSIVLSRKPFSKNHILTQGRTGYVDLLKFNPSEIKRAIEKSDYVINLTGTLLEKDFFKIHSDLPELISKLCAENKKIKKLIHISACGASKNSKSAYQQSKYLGEERVLNNFSSSVIIRPSLVVGAEDSFTNLWGKLSFFPIIPLVGSKFRFQPIWVNCLAQAIVNALDKTGNEGKIYEIGGDKIFSFQDLVKLILRIIGKKRIIFDVPIFQGKILGTVLQLFPGKPILTKDQCVILSEKDNVISDKYLKINDLGISPADIEKKMSDWLVQYRKFGQFTKV